MYSLTCQPHRLPRTTLQVFQAAGDHAVPEGGGRRGGGRGGGQRGGQGAAVRANGWDGMGWDGKGREWKGWVLSHRCCRVEASAATPIRDRRRRRSARWPRGRWGPGGRAGQPCGITCTGSVAVQYNELCMDTWGILSPDWVLWRGTGHSRALRSAGGGPWEQGVWGSCDCITLTRIRYVPRWTQPHVCSVCLWSAGPCWRDGERPLQAQAFGEGLRRKSSGCRTAASRRTAAPGCR